MAGITAAQWWQPDDPEKKIPGVLLEDDDRRWVLELDGSFVEMPDTSSAHGPIPMRLENPDGVPILVGTTSNGQLISLIDCTVLDGTIPLPGSRGSTKIRPTVLVYDVHFKKAEDFRLTSLSIHFSNLDTWAATSGFTLRGFTPSFDQLDIHYSLPETVESVLPDGLKVGVDFSRSGPTFPAATSMHLVQQSWLRTTPVQALPYGDLLRVIENFGNLVALGVGELPRPLEMFGTCDGRDPSGVERSVKVRLIRNRAPIACAPRNVPHWDMLFTLPDVRERFGEFVSAWFSRADALQSLYDLYFGTLRSPSMYVEHRFINMFQALESYDRRTFVPPAEKAQKREEKITRILKAVGDRDRKWVEGKMRHGSEAAAAERISRLVEKFEAGWLLSTEEVTLAGNMRNYYTHFDPQREQHLPPIDERFQKMHHLAVRLRTLCELILLDAVGFERDWVRDRMQNTKRLERHLGI